MDKQKIIKIAIATVVSILAMIYYFSNKQETTTYDNVLSSDVIVENKTEDRKSTRLNSSHWS